MNSTSETFERLVRLLQMNTLPEWPASKVLSCAYWNDDDALHFPMREPRSERHQVM